MAALPSKAIRYSFLPIDYDIYAIDAGTGTLKWKLSQTIGPSPNGEFSSPVAGNGLLFSANSNGLLYAMDLATGVIKWKYGTP